MVYLLHISGVDTRQEAYIQVLEECWVLSIASTLAGSLCNPILGLIFQAFEAYESISYNKYEGFMTPRQEKNLFVTSDSRIMRRLWSPCRPPSAGQSDRATPGPHCLRHIDSSTGDMGC
jgi:hypothetical protein